MNRIPTVDELVEAALQGGQVPSQETPPSEKIAAVTQTAVDEMEETASALEKWAEEAGQGQEQEKQASSEQKKASQHNRILKLAMASIILNTLKGLSDHGQLDQLIEKDAVARFAKGPLGAIYRLGGAQAVAQRHAAQRMRDPFVGLVGRTGQRLARVGGGPTAGEISARAALGKTKRQMKTEVARERQRAAAAESRTAGEKGLREQAEETTKKWRIGAGAAGAAGLAGAGLAYQAGAGRERERARAAQKFRRY